MKTVLEHFENGAKVFNSITEFKTFAELIFNENEDGESPLFMPRTYAQWIVYFYTYCGNFDVIEHGALLASNYQELNSVD